MNRCKNYGLGYIDNSNAEVGFFSTRWVTSKRIK